MDTVPLARLECEWRALLGTRLRLLFRNWAKAEPALARFESPSAVLAFLHSPERSDDKDAVLAALLRRADDEPLAGRFVLEALMPGLKTLARRVLAQGSERQEVWALLLACAWQRICAYPLERRPSRIAANLLLDTLHDVVVFLTAERRHRAELAPEEPPPASASCTRPSAGVDQLLALAVERGAITEAEAELVLASRFDGRKLASVADEQGVAYNTLKVRRQRAERRLLIFLGYPPVPRGRQPRPSSAAR